jgi:hypothetical protein
VVPPLNINSARPSGSTLRRSAGGAGAVPSSVSKATVPSVSFGRPPPATMTNRTRVPSRAVVTDPSNAGTVTIATARDCAR